MHLLHQASSFSDLCSTAILRSVNGVLAIVCGILFYEIITKLRPTLDRKKATLFSVILSLYPLHWFFTYLFYTDVASLTVFLGMYLASLKNKYLLSALLGALAICIRQTNVIWMLFVACSSIIEMLLVHGRHSTVKESGVSHGEKICMTPKYDISVNPGLKRRKNTVDAPSPVIPNDHEAAVSSAYISGLIDEIHSILSRAWLLKVQLLVSFSPFVLVLGSFAVFIYWNGSVVLGAKEAHFVSPHFAQIMYFALVSVLFSVPYHLTLRHGFGLLQMLRKSKPLSFALVFGAMAAGVVSVHFFSFAHPYLLADNRHYTFYIWRKVLNAHWSMRYLLVPVYVYSWLSILGILGKTKSKIWVVAYFLACAAVLVPTPLVEFRYYTIPFFIFMLNSGIEETRKWLLIGILYIAINVFTLCMFLYRPFYWTHEAGVQRFIW
ncbi:dol-P-Glc:Glc(2)Man(9)GlcNAc(2)-PP-Dol alpha-1,2-glucosyltransferase isoform X2 [Silene latifolia]